MARYYGKMVYAESGIFYDSGEIARLDDDGCPLRWKEVDELPTPGVTTHEFPEPLPSACGLYRIYSCGNCGWFVWHSIHYCHKCGGRMRMLKGKTKDLQVHMKRNGFEDGGF